MAFSEVFAALSYISAFSVLIPLSLAIFRWPVSGSISKILAIYLLLSLLTEITLTVFLVKEIPATIICNIFSLLEFVLVFTIFILQLKPQGLVKYFFWVPASFVVASFFAFRTDEAMDAFNGLYSALLIFLGLYFFYKENKDMKVPVLMDYYFFWLNSGFLFYFAFSFFIFLTDQFIMAAEKNVAMVIWTLHLLINMIYYGILTLGIWKTNGKQH